jgi:sarcosine/dimethylglycine N-methyltransferase
MAGPSDIASTVANTREYYDGPADEIYRLIWGDNLHLGVPCNPDCPHPEAMEHTNEIMSGLANLGPAISVLDLGCGYGSTARYLARTHGCRVTGINISEKELELAGQRAAEAGLERFLSFEPGDFHDLRYDNESFDVVWSQEAFLHGADKRLIISEARRVLVDSGVLIFTDVVVKSDTPATDRARIYDRIRSPEMWDSEDYRVCLAEQGFHVRHERDWSEYVARSYSWVRDSVLEHREELLARTDAYTIDRTLDGLGFWVEAANDGKIGWSLFVAVKGSTGSAS